MPTFAKNDDEVKNKYLFAVTATCFLILLLQFNWSQKIETSSVENGLPRGFVSSICQDKKGFIWAATPDGVCRFDGERFKLFSDSDKRAGSLASKYVSRFLLDRDSAMWLMVDHRCIFMTIKKISL